MHNAEYSFFYFATFFPDYFNNGETSSTTIHRYFLNNKTILHNGKKIPLYSCVDLFIANKFIFKIHI